MSSVDNRVVNMIFDNKQFEQGIQTSIKSLEALKKGLNLEEASKGLHDIDKTAKGISFATLTNGVEAISVKFSALGVIAITVLQNITNSVINTGKKIVSSLTLDPVMDGFREYELKMDSVQTIMNGTGATIEEVSAKLNELNEYADRTIYSFGDMTSNIGKFTNAGVGLDDAVGAIQGVANAAALSGSNATQASHAMYNFAQALAAGYVKLIDWKSIETANMATVEFKTQLLESAVAAGTLAKSADGMYTVLTKNGSGSQMKETISATKNFNDSLAYQWMTTEVLVKTLNDYADETTDIGKRAFKAATEVKTFTQLLDTMQEAVGSGWAQTWEILIGNFDEAKEVLTEISQAFESVINASADARNNMLESWKELGGRTAIIDGLRNTIEGLLSVITPIKEAFRDIFPPMTAENLLVITERFKSFTEKLKLSDTASENLNRTFKGLFAMIDIGKEAFFAFTNALKSVVSYFLPVGDGVLSMTGSFGDFLVSIRDVIKDTDVFNKIFETLGSVIKPVADVVKNAIESIFDSLASFKTVDTTGVEDVGKRFERGFKPFTAIANLVKGAFDIIVKVVEKVAPLFTGLASAIGKGLGAAQKAIMDWLNDVNFSAGLDLFNAGVFATVLLGIRKFTKSLTDITDNADGIIGGIKEIFGGITGTFEALQSRLKADTLIKIATAIGVLTASVVVLSMIDSDKVATSLTAIAVLFTELFASMAIFEKVMLGSGFASMIKVSSAMILMSTAVLILATAMKKLSDLDWSGITKGLISVGVLMGELILAVKLIPNEGRMMKGAGSLILFATAINILANAVKKLGELDVATLTNGLIGVGVLLSELALFMKMTDLDGMGLLKGLGIMALATALVILSSAVKKLGELDTATIIQGLIGVGAVLAELGIFMNMTGDVTKVMSTAVGLTILGAAMLIFAKAIENMGQMTWEEIAKGLITMGGALTIITVALQFVQGALGGAAALLVIAGALAILTPVLKVLGGMTWQEIATGLITLAGTFAVIGGAALLLAPVTPAILALAGSITLLGVAVTLIGGGVLALSAGLAALGVAGTAGVSALVLAVTGLIGLIPMFIQQIANALIIFANVIGEGAPAIIKAVASVLIAISEAIIQAVPTMVKAIVLFLDTMLKAIVEFVPKLVDGGMKLILGILKGISDNIKKIVETAIEIVINFIDGISSMIPKVIQAGVDLIINFIDGLAEAIRGNTDTMIEAMSNLITAIIEAGIKMLKGSLNLFKDVGGLIMDSGFIKGIRDKFGKITDTIKEIPGKIISTLSGYMGDFLSIGGDIIGGITKGITGGISKVTEAAKDVAKGALEGAKKFLKIQSPSKVFQKDVGENIGAGMIEGMENITPKVKTASSKMSESVYEMSKKWIDKQRKYHDLSLDAELSKWKETLKYYKEGQDEYYEILNHIADTENRIRQQSFENSKNWIAKEKELNRLSLFEELEAWERVQARYAEGTEQRKEADREYARVRGEIIEQMKQIDQEYLQGTEEINAKLMEDIQAVTEAYEKAVEDRANAIFRSFGLFDEVSMDEEVSGRDLIKNLQDQVNAIDLWASEFERLAKKGINEGLLEELRNMGPKALPQLQALNKLTDRELSLYSELWETKMFLARTQAEKELEGMKEDTEIKIEELRNQADKDLEALKETWKTKTESITKTVVDEYKIMGADIIESLRALNNRSRTQFDQNNKDMKSVIHNEDWNSLGRYIVEGVSSGVDDHSSSLIKAMIQLGRKAKKAMEDELGIKSPSKVFEKIGQFTIEGLIEGLKDKKHMNVLSGVMNKITELIDGDMTLAPTIRPVLDMGGVTTGLNSVFSKEQLLRTRQSMQIANNISRTSRSEIPSTIDRTQHITEINNEFVVHATIREEADIRKLSQELYSLQQQTSRGRGVR